jgi:hypothetical protein
LLHSKNDESRFGLTRAPFCPPRDGIGEAKAHAYRRARQDGNGAGLGESAVAEEFGWQAWVFAALAFIYGLAMMTVVIVTLAKSARVKGQREEKSG